MYPKGWKWSCCGASLDEGPSVCPQYTPTKHGFHYNADLLDSSNQPLRGILVATTEDARTRRTVVELYYLRHHHLHHRLSSEVLDI